MALIEKELAVFREKEKKEIHLDEMDLKKIAFLQMIAGHFEK